MIEFVSYVIVVTLASAFLLSLAVKWGWLEWLQVHAPNDFLEKLFNCKFCCSWWVSVILSLTLCVATVDWWLVFVPVCSTVITRELW